MNPVHYNPKDPITLFIIQAVIIIVFCRLLHYPLSKLGQPRVIAEVIGGVLLGPSVMGRIPGFTNTIFYPDSMPVLNNAANLGLLIYLFVIGLEVDTRMFTHNWRVAAAVGFAGMALPFGLGVAIAVGLYEEFRHEAAKPDMSFGTFALFIGTALSITAFPVLCRILSELQLLNTPVGITVLAAGIGNDVTGWVLLALSVALVNNADGLAALYVFLTAVAWVLFLVFAVRPIFIWTLRRNGSIQNGPSQGIIALTLVMVLISSWFTAAIGVHAIFGAFLIGVICPHQGGFAIKLTEKIEDLISVLLLPLYFALSGLRTNLSLLNNGITWGYVFGIIIIAFFGKIVGGLFAARASRLLWRESFAIGVLMSCKGLVELIVLNIGLQAGILSERTFTMFVVMALVTTVATTPLCKRFYPQSYQKKVELWKRGEVDWDGNPLITEAQATEQRMVKALDQAQASRVAMHLRLDSLGSLFNIVSLLGDSKRASERQSEKPTNGSESNESSTGDATHSLPMPPPRPLEVHGIRLLELTDRTSSVMQSAELDELANQDAVFSAFQTFSHLNGVAVAGHVAVVPTSRYADTLVEHAKAARSDLMFVPWSRHGSLAEDATLTLPEHVSFVDRFFSRQHIDFVQTALSTTECTTGIYISPTPEDPGMSKKPNQLRRVATGISVHSGRDALAVRPRAGRSQHVFLPFIGGADDQAALLFVLQLANNPQVTVTIAHMKFAHDDAAEAAATSSGPKPTVAEQSVTVKEAVMEPSASDLELLFTARHSIANTTLEPRVNFIDHESPSASGVPARVLEIATETFASTSDQRLDTIIIIGRKHACFTSLWTRESGLERDFQRTVGVLGDKIARSGTKAGLLIMNAKKEE